MSDCEVRFDAEDLVRATGGAWRRGEATAGLVGVCTDTRLPLAGRLFLALRGEKFDAHDFLERAVSAGASALCVAAGRADRIPADCPVPVLLVGDTLDAYRSLGRFHRLRFPDLRLAAVTGSVGKTSVKEMLRAIFIAACGGDDEAVLGTAGNTNNQIGVPQNLLRVNGKRRFAVIEMGTSQPGEIEPLSRAAMPECAVISAIAPCHLEHLGSLEGVAREKAHVFDGVLPGGTAVFPAICPGKEILQERAKELHVCRFGRQGSGADVTWEYMEGNLSGSRFRLHMEGRCREIRWSLSGEHQAQNAAAAAAAALAMGISADDVAAGLAGTALPGMRMARRETGGVVYVNDAYNASPASMVAALRQMAESVPSRRLVLVLGDMLELGAAEASEHRRILEMAGDLLPEARVLAVGPRFADAAAAEGRPDVVRADDSVSAAAVLAGIVRPGDVVFLKGSRGMAMEKALPDECRDVH